MREYRINGDRWPQPEATEWNDVQNGSQLSTNLPIYSPYRRHVWRYPILPNCEFPQRLEDIRGVELTSLVTDPPTDADVPTEYTEAKVIGITRTHQWGQVRGVNIEFEVYVG